MSGTAVQPLSDFRSYADAKLAEYVAQIRRCTSLLTADQAWQRPNEHSNSVANLLLHLRGNVTQWIVSGLGGRSFERDRPAEFAAREQRPTGPLMEALDQTIRESRQIIAGLSDARLAEEVEIQGYRMSALSAVFHVVEHFAFHTGQIVWATKAILDIDLSLYDAQGHRLDQRTTGAP